MTDELTPRPGEDEISCLVRNAWSIPDGPKKVAMMEHALGLAEREGSLRRVYELRLLLLKSAVYAGEHAKAFVAFSWCVAHHDQLRDQQATRDLLSSFKDILMNVPYLPEVPREEIFALEDEMERWFTRYGHSLRAVHAARMTCRIEMGRFDEIKQHHTLWVAARRDEMCWWPEAEADQELSYLFASGQTARGISLAELLHDGSGARGISAMQHIRARVIRPLMQADRHSEARDYGTAGLNCPRGATFAAAQHVAEYVLPFVMDGELHESLTHLTTTLLGGTDEHDRCRLYDVIAVVLQRLHSESTEPLALNLPSNLPIHSSSGLYDPQTTADWFEAAAGAIADRFDARNGTPYYTDFISQTRELLSA